MGVFLWDALDPCVCLSAVCSILKMCECVQIAHTLDKTQWIPELDSLLYERIACQEDNFGIIGITNHFSACLRKKKMVPEKILLRSVLCYWPTLFKTNCP